MFKQLFQGKFGWNKVKYARIMITNVFYIALTLQEMFEYSAYQPLVQTASPGPGKC